MATFPIYQFYVELDGYEPKMWRRFQVMNHINICMMLTKTKMLFRKEQ